MIHTWKPSPEEYDQCNRKARRDGLFAGVTGGLFAALFGKRLLKFDRRRTLASGLLAGALAGYFFSQAFLSTYLRQLERDTLERARLRATAFAQDPDSAQTLRGVPNQTTNSPYKT